MKKKKASQGKKWVLRPPAQRPAAAPRNDCRQLIWVDSAPQRREESKAYVALKKKIATAAAAVEHFERVTLPEFERWHARSFGVLLTEQRALQAAIEEKLALFEEVRDEQWRGGGSEAAAYQRVLRARARRAAGLAEEDPAAAEDDDFEVDDEEFFEAMFRDAVHNLFGIDVESLRPKDREAMRNAFRRDYGLPTDDDPPPSPRARKKEKPATPEQAALETRCKQIYRRLVRRLHPDTGVEPSPQARQLWHDLQDAWQKRDLERLELLQAVVELQDDGTEAAFAAVSLDRLRRIVRELAQAWRDLQKRRQSLQRHPASQLTDPAKAKSLEKKVRTKLQEDIRGLQTEIADVDRLLAQWQKSAPKKKSARDLPGQEHFGF